MSTFQTLFSQDIGRLNWRTVLDSFFSAFNQFRTISFIDIIDILIVAYIIYRIMKLLKDTSAERLIKGIIILVGITHKSHFLQKVRDKYLARITFFQFCINKVAQS